MPLTVVVQEIYALAVKGDDLSCYGMILKVGKVNKLKLDTDYYYEDIIPFPGMASMSWRV